MNRSEGQTRDAIETQAAAYLAASLGDLDPAARQAIADWIECDPRHAVAYAQAEVAWDAGERLKGQDFSTQASLRPPSIQLARGVTRRRLVAGASVAAAAAVFGAPVFVWLARATRYSTAIGEARDVALADGSRVHLNTDSQVEVALSAARRQLSLVRGEAYFDVAHDAKRPFDVAVPGGVVRAIGTAFNIRLRGAIVELTVTHGIVGVRTAEGVMRRIPAGESAVIQPRTVAVGKMDESAIAKRVAWRERMILLNGETVGEAVAEFNRYRAAPILIGDSRIAGLRIGGRFRTDESSDFLQALEQTLPVHSAEEDSGSVLLMYADQTT
ncbi:FecR domain-containing protein [Sphingomonas sp. NFR15]|uniref:FecR family protein n=1 Tax=Sphingomonas sp. NFR15 TaxID=1566282 RepID=UPI00210AA754|nr:FecR domain-containing protein [Sphingomonas sp. NFR15]